MFNVSIGCCSAEVARGMGALIPLLALPSLQEELDPVTLHNLALMHMESDPTGGFRKFNFLLQSPPFPPETFGERPSA